MNYAFEHTIKFLFFFINTSSIKQSMANLLSLRFCCIDEKHFITKHSIEASLALRGKSNVVVKSFANTSD